MTTCLDLLLVNAPARTGVYGKLTELAAIEPPVWAGLIARYCLNKGFTVKILDAEAEGLNVTETARRIIEAHPRLVVFCIYGQQPSASTQCLPAASAVCRAVKEVANDHVPMLALGTHPSALSKHTLYEEPFDYVVCQGEGPYTIEPMLLALKFRADLHSLPTHLMPPGLLCRKGAITLHANPATNIERLDQELPSQAWELLDMSKYRAHNWHLWSQPIWTYGQEGIHTAKPTGGYASVQTSLGCAFTCTFCCIQAPFGDGKPRMRFWSPANVASQIADLSNRYNITNIKIPDEMFCLNRQHVWQICNHLIDMKLGERLNMWAYARIDTVKDEAMLDHMRLAGFRWLGLGIESGSKHIRDSVEKGRFGNNDIVRAVHRVRSAGIHVGANYIFGLPDDTRESMQETLDLACYLNTEWANFYCAMAYPGSALHIQVSREHPEWLPENAGVGWIGYSQHAYETFPLPTKSCTREEVLAFRDEAFMHYFSRPEYFGMIENRFGVRATTEVNWMLALNKPKRKLLGDVNA